MAKTGFVFSGAGARIPQLCVLAKNLVNGSYADPDDPAKNGPPIKPDVISGASSGSLTAVALNAILAGKYSFEELESDLIKLKNTPYDEGAQKNYTIYMWLPGNIGKGYLLQTKSLIYPHDLLYHAITNIFKKKLGYAFLKDLDPAYPVYITTVSKESGKTLYIKSTDPDYQDYPVVDLLMASTAIPVVFPPWQTDEFGECVDGGTGQGSVPVDAMKGENCDTLWLLCRQGENPLGRSLEDFLVQAIPQKEIMNQEQSGTEDFMVYRHWDPASKGPEKARIFFETIAGNAVFALDKIETDSYTSQTERAKEYASSVYSYIPVLDTSYSMLNFNKAREQIEDMNSWCASNPPKKIQ